MSGAAREGENAAGRWRWKAGSGHRRTPAGHPPDARTDDELDPHKRPPAAHERADERLYYDDQTPGLDEAHCRPGHPHYQPKGTT